MSFAEPAWLWLLAIVPLLAVFAVIRPREWSLPYTSLAVIRELAPSWRQRLHWLPTGLILCALSCLLLVQAKPQHEVASSRERQQGIAIELLVDVSTSMDMQLDAKKGRSTRLAAAKDVLQRFVLGDGKTFTGLSGNLIGLTSFARYADTVCPLTFSATAVADMAADLQLSRQPNEDGTAYGDAVALAAAQLSRHEQLNASGGEVDRTEPPIVGKVIILLTDGENNSGRHLPLEAASMAKTWGIRVYTISLGQASGPELIKSGDDTIALGDQLSEADWILKKMAESTGGIFRKVYDQDTLESVYADIERIEKSSISTVSFQRFAPLAWPFLLIAMASVLLALGLECGPLRRLA